MPWPGVIQSAAATHSDRDASVGHVAKLLAGERGHAVKSIGQHLVMLRAHPWGFFGRGSSGCVSTILPPWHKMDIRPLREVAMYMVHFGPGCMVASLFAAEARPAFRLMIGRIWRQRDACATTTNIQFRSYSRYSLTAKLFREPY